MSQTLDITGGPPGNNGTGVAAFFNVDALTGLIVPFEFPFEGQTLKGHWFKYKTTTPDHIRERRERYMQRLEQYAGLEAQFKGTSNPEDVLKLQAEKNDLEEEAQRVKYSWLGDAIADWNAVDNNQQPIPIDVLKMASFPLPFLVAFGDYLIGTRTGENPT